MPSMVARSMFHTSKPVSYFAFLSKYATKFHFIGAKEVCLGEKGEGN